MYLLSNQHLRVHVLDPIQDQIRLGPRFCTGGYVYQVEDSRHGPLLSGPEYPTAFPAVTNGQGLPEVFQFTLFNHEHEIEEQKLIIGAGIVDKREPALPYHLFTNAKTESFCTWQISSSDTHLRFETTQAFKEWSLRLIREVSLLERIVCSRTTLQNIGDAHIPFRWFAHPFFPLTHDYRCCRVAGLSSLPENPGFRLDDAGFIVMNAEHIWREGCYLKWDDLVGRHLEAQQCHDRLGRIRVSCDFPMTDLAIWANDKTFSVEPFYQGTVLPDRERQWRFTFTFEALG